MRDRGLSRKSIECSFPRRSNTCDREEYSLHKSKASIHDPEFNYLLRVEGLGFRVKGLGIHAFTYFGHSNNQTMAKFDFGRWREKERGRHRERERNSCKASTVK